MWKMLLPILIVVLANTFYNISAKSTPENVNSFASLTISYAVAAVCSFIMFLLTSGAGKRGIACEFTKTNWTAYVLGIAIVGLEFGFLCVYRAGWKISTEQLFSSALLSCVLLVVGFTVYRESIGIRQLAGIAVCLIGLFLIAK